MIILNSEKKCFDRPLTASHIFTLRDRPCRNPANQGTKEGCTDDFSYSVLTCGDSFCQKP